MAAAPLVVIVGPTASGKTALAINLAKHFDGEIICADSRTVYRGMDIGTAKPTEKERSGVPHWGLDIVEPGQRFTAADFQRYAKEKIDDIRKRKKIPFLVGGTGLYVDAVLFDYRFATDRDSSLRQKLQEMTLEQLHDYCSKNNINLPENHKNKRYVIRAIEQKSINNRRQEQPLTNSIIVGITTNPEDLRTRIERRTEQLFADGVVEEAKKLGNKYGWDSEAMTGTIYRLARQYVQGEITLDEGKKINAIRDWQLAKRQLTWLRRNDHIEWRSLDDAYADIATRLDKWHES